MSFARSASSTGGVTWDCDPVPVAGGAVAVAEGDGGAVDVEVLLLFWTQAPTQKVRRTKVARAVLMSVFIFIQIPVAGCV